MSKNAFAFTGTTIYRRGSWKQRRNTAATSRVWLAIALFSPVELGTRRSSRASSSPYTLPALKYRTPW